MPRHPDPHETRAREMCREAWVYAAVTYHKPITTLAEWDALDSNEVVAGHISAEKGDPEPGANHSRAYHHGWRTAQMDLGEIPRPPEHDRLVRGLMDRDRIARGENPRWPDRLKAMS